MDSRLQLRVDEARDALRRTKALDTMRCSMTRSWMGCVARLAIFAMLWRRPRWLGGLRVGDDVIEWIAAAAAALGAYFATRLAWPALLVVAVFLAYQAQCYSARALPRVRKADK